MAREKLSSRLLRRILGDAFITKSRGTPVRLAVRATVQKVIGFLRFELPGLPALATYRSYRPDSDYVFDLQPEFGALRRKWLAKNRQSNGGDLSRLYFLILNIKQLFEENVAGDFAELGVFRGNSAAVLAHFARLDGRRVYLFDTFSGFDERDLQGIDAGRRAEFKSTSVSAVKRLVGGDGLVSYVAGFFPGSLTPEVYERSFAFVQLDCDLYEPMKAGLEFFYPRLVPGGMLVLHDYSSSAWAGAKRAVDEFCLTIFERPILLPDKSGTAALRKGGLGFSA